MTIKGDATARVVDGELIVRIPGWMSHDEAGSLVADVVARYEQRWRCGHVPLAARARELARRFGLPEPSSIDWSFRQHKRWGSCSVHNGTIRISSRLAQAPPWVLDHVIIHELAHLVASDHGERFNKLVSQNPYAERAEGYLLAMNDLAPGPARFAGNVAG